MGLMKNLYTGRSRSSGRSSSGASGARSKSAGVWVTGDKALDEALRKLGDEKTTRKIVASGMAGSLIPVLNAASANAPRGKDWAFDENSKATKGWYVTEQGKFRKRLHLQDSIKVKAGASKKNYVERRVVTGTRDELGIPPDAKGYYPSALEFGYTHAKSGRQVPGRYYMLRALTDNAHLVVGK